MGQSDEPMSFRPDIDGLRAVAVLSVILFHAEIPGFGGGYIGVDVFFVISGFLITRMLWREATTSGTVRLRRFYGARARRLLPAAALVGIATMVCAAALLPPLRAQSVIADGIASALYVSNYRFALQGIDYFASSAPPSPFQHYWSLGVEEQFYLLWPALILGTAWLIRLTSRRTRTDATASTRSYIIVLAIVVTVSSALSLVLTIWAPPLAFFSLPTRAWQLGAGGLVALTAFRWERLSSKAATVVGWVGLCMFLPACILLNKTTPYPGIASLLPTIGAVFVIAAGCAKPANGCGMVLGCGPMRAIGRVSYSWYLWHWPVLCIALWSFAPVLGHALAWGVGGLLLSGLLAFLTLRFIENPVRFAVGLRSSANGSLAVGAAVTASAVAVGMVLHVPDPVGRGPAAPNLVVTTVLPSAGSSGDVYHAMVSRAFAYVQTAVTASLEVKDVPSNLSPRLADVVAKSHPCQQKVFKNMFGGSEPDCVVGNANSRITVALVGDSNAFMWRPALEQVINTRRWRLKIMTKGSCPFLELPIINPIVGRPFIECSQWRDQIKNQLKSELPQLVVISMMRRYGASFGWPVGFTSYDQSWITSLNRQVRDLRASGTQVLVLGPIPNPQSDPADCLSVHLDNAPACATSRSTGVNGAGIAAELNATRAADGNYADLTELFCAIDRCPAIVGNNLVYVDAAHITEEYSLALAPVIGALADRTLAHI